jgi:uncharacterized phage-associated protein
MMAFKHNVVEATRVRLRFNEAKATQAAGLLLALRGGTMSYMKLIKLLYLADREALLRWDRPITTDRWVSMDNGPVVSRIYGLIREEPVPGVIGEWARHIQASDRYDVCLVEPVDDGELSSAEVKLLRQIFALHGHKNRWDLVKYCHELPEWRRPNGSSVPIEVEDILRGENRPADEIDEVVAELDNIALVQQMV